MPTPTTADSATSPEILFIGPGNADPLFRPLEKAGFKIVARRPTKKALEETNQKRWRAILVHSSTPESFIEAFAKKGLASPVLLLSQEWPCKRPQAENWTCIRQPSGGERLIRDFVFFLSQNPAGEKSSFPSWVDQVLPATRAKSSFSKVLQDVENGARVVVTKHEHPSVVVVSYEDYEALQAQTERALDRMRARFGTLVAEMQKPAFERGMDALFGSTPEELGQTAVQAARSRD